ncbi:MAG: flagellar hook-basal body protein [Syntrophobacterales bacterium]|nr:flagellar hook-basal body protein [Syntrophobacterales bacterium]
MRIGSYAVTVGSINQTKKIEVIGNNLANASTPGFKKEDVRFIDFVYAETHTDMTQGNIKTTSQSLDVALVGNGFFKVQKKEGIFYTRAGNFMLDASGQLILPDGSLVLGKNGSPITLKSYDVIIDEGGRIFEGGKVVDQLAVVSFDKSVKMERVGYNLFKPSDKDAKEQDAKEVVVKQGSLEEANFNVVEEMTKMIDTMRAFEAYTKVYQVGHEEDRQLIRRVVSR